MTPDLHPELDDLIFYSMGSSDAPEAAAVMDRVRAHLQTNARIAGPRWRISRRI